MTHRDLEPGLRHEATAEANTRLALMVMLRDLKKLREAMRKLTEVVQIHQEWIERAQAKEAGDEG